MNASWKWPGSRWWRFELHTYSPASHDFRGESEPETPDWARWVTAVSNAGIHAVAITDHNTGEAIKPLQDAASGLEGAPVLFPGVELTAGDGTHLLLLMDPDREQRHVDDLLSRMEVPADGRGQQDARSLLSVEQILDRCGHDVLVVGAHVNGPDGLLQLEGQQRIAVLQNRGLVAVEVDPCKEIQNHWLDGSQSQIGRPISQVWSSDGHCFDELGQRFTWVKMTRPNLDGLRLALLDGTASLKPAARGAQDDPNAHTDLAVESITVNKGKFMGRSSPIEVKLSPWLNTIIGGRGTGKSTLVDLFRKTLRRESELDDRQGGEEGLLRSFFDRRMSVPASRSDEGLLTEETCVELVYRKDGERFVLLSSQDGAVPPIARLDGNERIIEEGDIRERFPVRIYSQKQLFALAQDPNALLTVIDDSQTVRRVDLNRSIKQMADRYLSLCAEVRVARNRADNLQVRRAALADVRRKLEVLQSGGHAEALREYRKRRQQDDTWQAIQRTASDAVDEVEKAAGELSVSDLDLGADVENDQTSVSLRRAHATLKRAVENLQRSVHEAVEQTRKGVQAILAGTDIDQWREVMAASAREYQTANAKLAELEISDQDQYGSLLEQEAELVREIEALENDCERAKTLQDDAATTLAEYRQQRDELSDRRQSFVCETSGEIIRVEVDAYADIENLADELGQTLGIERFEGDRKAIARRIEGEPDEAWHWGRLDRVVAEMRQFLSADLESWETQDHRFQAALNRVPPERIDRLALYLPEDTVTVSFQDRRGGGWTPLAQGSPGQQTAALLAFVLGYGNEPIILDQPEDDLDNTLIYELVVSRLRETKLNRQVIVVTHNPNIVVHGDAELVLSLKAASGETRIACQGGLQERKVRDEICRVMEGGQEAFESRYQRIMPPREQRP